jgi:hypothetical protein
VSSPTGHLRAERRESLTLSLSPESERPGQGERQPLSQAQGQETLELDPATWTVVNTYRVCFFFGTRPAEFSV